MTILPEAECSVRSMSHRTSLILSEQSAEPFEAVDHLAIATASLRLFQPG
jgi:hypothetical protein